MSRLNNLLLEVKERLTAIDNEFVSLKGRVVIAYNEADLLDLIKGLKSYPAVGIVFEGMRSMAEAGPTMKVGGSGEAVIGLVLVEQGNATFAGDQRRARAVDYLEVMRDAFMTKRSTTTSHMWHFMVEAPAALKSGMVVWVQRWSVPIQLFPALPMPVPVPPPDDNQGQGEFGEQPRLVYVALSSVTEATINGFFAVTVTYDRPLQLVGSDPISISLKSSDPNRHADFVIPYSPFGSELDTRNEPWWMMYGVQSMLAFQLYPIDLTGLEGIIATCSNASLRVGWGQFKDLMTGSNLPTIFDPPYYTSTFVKEPSTVVTLSHPFTPFMAGL